MTKICILGCGYVGLPLAMFLAKSEFEVLGVDIDESKIKQLSSGVLTLLEEGIEDLWNDSKVRKNIKFSIIPQKSDIFIIAVPTPLNSSKNNADLNAVQNAINMILNLIEPENLIILESTVPPGTSRAEIYEKIKENRSNNLANSVFIAHCPEQVLPGKIMKEFVEIDRIIGGINEESSKKAAAIYKTFITGKCYLTDLKTAEFTKLAQNTYRMINITFANELEQFAKQYNVNNADAIQLANKHPRVNILNPGIGIGGECIAIDPLFLINNIDNKNGQLIKLSLKLTNNRPYIIAERIIKQLQNNQVNSHDKILLLGRSYKPDVKDDRKSPALEIINILQEKNFAVSTYDPYFDENLPLSIIAKEHNAIILLVKHTKLLEDLDQNYDFIKNELNDPKFILQDPLK